MIKKERNYQKLCKDSQKIKKVSNYSKDIIKKTVALFRY